MSGLRTPLLIKCWYCFVVMMILYTLPTLDSVKLNSNQSTIPNQASSNTTVLPTLRPSLFLTPIPSLPPKIVSTVSSPIVATSSPPTVSRGPTSSPTVTFLPIEGSTCSDTCGAERELVNNDNIQERILEYSDEGKMKKIHCLNTSNITKMNYLLSSYDNFGGDVRFRFFNTDLSCWNVSSVTRMEGMFDSASAFNNNISSWDVSSVTNMWNMFYSASAFNNNITSWDVSSVKDMTRMFEGATKFNSDVSDWDVSSVNWLDRMFNGASEFNQQMCDWKIIDNQLSNMFDGSLCSVKSCLECTEE